MLELSGMIAAGCCNEACFFCCCCRPSDKFSCCWLWLMLVAEFLP